MNKKTLFEDYKPIEGECWKKIPLCEDYEVSNLGRVKVGSYIVVPSDKCGYSVVRIHKKGSKKSSNFLVHRLVANSFIANKEGKPEVDHIDTNKKNNCVENLRWCWHLENMIGNKTTLEKMNKGYRKKVIYESIRQDLSYRDRLGVEIFYNEDVKKRVVEILDGETTDNLINTLMPSDFGKKTISKYYPSNEKNEKETKCTIFFTIDDIHTNLNVKINGSNGKIVSVKSYPRVINVKLENGKYVELKMSDLNASLK